MRKEKLAALVHLARALAGSGDGLTLDDMAAEAGVGRRTAERMRDTLVDLFPTLEEVPDGRGKRFRIPNGVDGFTVAPTPEELAEVDHAARALEAQGGTARAALLRSLGAKLKARLRERGKAEPVLYRLDRVAGLELGAYCGPLPAGFDLGAFAARAFGAYQEKPEAVVLRFAPEAAADVARFSFHSDQTIEDEPGGGKTVHFTAGGMRELAHHLFTWGTAVEIVAPERLRAMLVAELRAALERHTGAAPCG